MPSVTGKVYNHSKRMKEKRAVLDAVAGRVAADRRQACSYETSGNRTALRRLTLIRARSYAFLSKQAETRHLAAGVFAHRPPSHCWDAERTHGRGALPNSSVKATGLKRTRPLAREPHLLYRYVQCHYGRAGAMRTFSGPIDGESIATAIATRSCVRVGGYV